MKKVIVTGATGFLGMHLIDELIRNNFEVIAVCRRLPEKSYSQAVTFYQGDIEDPYSLREAFIQASIVVHAAALVSADPTDNHQMYQTNVIGTRNVVDACLFSGVKRLIYVSSVAALIGDSAPEKISEPQPWNGPLAGYGYTKYKGGMEVRRGEAEGLEVVFIHPSVIFGPGDADRSSGKILKLIRNGLPFAPRGVLNGVDARDVSELLVRMIKGEGTGKNFVVSGFSMNWKDFYESVLRGYGNSKRILIIPTQFAILFIWIYEKLSRLIRLRPLITVNAIKMATSGNSYDSKIVAKELGFIFRTPEETLNWLVNTKSSEFRQFKQN